MLRFPSSNLAPRDHNLDCIRTCKACYLVEGQACLACQEYLQLDSMLSASDRTTPGTAELKRALRTKINEIHDLITSNFPFEIVSVIFQFTLPTDFGALYNKGSSTNLAGYNSNHLSRVPLILCAICRSWRQIAWETPQLWTTLCLFLGGWKNRTQDLDMAQGWVKRAGQLPLSILISWNGHYYSNNNHIDQSLVSLVNQQSSRWDAIEIRGPPLFVASLTGDCKGAPKLSTLAIHAGPGEDFHFSMVGKKPAPTKVSALRGSFKWLDIDWRYTTEVFAAFSLDECFEILRRAPHLKHCKFSIAKKIDSVSEFRLPQEPITHNSLQSLEFIFNKHIGTGVNQLLETYTFPLLTDLIFDQRLGVDWTVVIAHIRRSECQLTSLEIKSQCDHNELISVLLNTPLLRKLRITEPHPDLFTLFAETAILTSGGIERTFLPNLETLNVWPRRGSPNDDDYWHQILGIFGPMSRIRNSHVRRRPLNKLQINQMWRPTEGILSIGINQKTSRRIAQLIEAGIILEVNDWHNQYNLLELAMARHETAS